MRVAAAILAGGKASRLGGICKGLLPAGDVSIVGRLIAEFTAAGIAEIVISANDPHPYTQFACPIIADRQCDIGPLGGIEAVLYHLAARCDSVALVPCDLPAITFQEILKLIAAQAADPQRIAFAMASGGEHPLCAVVPVTILPEVQAAIAVGQYGVGRLWRACNAVPVEIDDPSRLANINTPQDFRAWQTADLRPGKE